MIPQSNYSFIDGIITCVWKYHTILIYMKFENIAKYGIRK